MLTQVQVQDLPNMPPVWIKPFTMERFNEKSIQQFEIEATDGDTGLNEDMSYRLIIPVDTDCKPYLIIIYSLFVINRVFS